MTDSIEHRLARLEAPEERRGKPLRIRLTGAERARLDLASGGSTSTWARSVLLAAADRVLNDGHPKRPKRPVARGDTD